MLKFCFVMLSILALFLIYSVICDRRGHSILNATQVIIVAFLSVITMTIFLIFLHKVDIALDMANSLLEKESEVMELILESEVNTEKE